MHAFLMDGWNFFFPQEVRSISTYVVWVAILPGQILLLKGHLMNKWLTDSIPPDLHKRLLEFHHPTFSLAKTSLVYGLFLKASYENSLTFSSTNQYGQTVYLRMRQLSTFMIIIVFYYQKLLQDKIIFLSGCQYSNYSGQYKQFIIFLVNKSKS